MGSSLIPLWPICDTVAFVVIASSVFDRIPFSYFGFSHYQSLACKAVLCFLLSLYIRKTVVLSSNSTSSSRQKTRQRIPSLWFIFIKAYARIFGSSFATHTSKAAAATLVTDAGVFPEMKYVLPNEIGFIFPNSKQLIVHINQCLWTQIYAIDDEVILYGLSPHTLYDIEVFSPLHNKSITFNACTACDGNRKELLRPVENLYNEALNSVQDTLFSEKTRLRKLKKDMSKRHQQLKRDIEASKLKTQSRRRGDERIRKRVQSLRDRFDQQKSELDQLMAETNNYSISELYSTAAASQRERQTKQLMLDTLRQKFEQQNQSKSKEINKEQQRLRKLTERKLKIEADRKRVRAETESQITEYIDLLRQQRLERKHRRQQVELELNAATACLLSS